jgi:membrane protease YdiL (CAAX protease family)
MPAVRFCMKVPCMSLFAPLVCTGQVAAPDAAALVRLLLVAPLLEEWVVRAGLQEWLIRRRSAATPDATYLHPGAIPVVASAIAFALLHLGSGWHAALAVLAPGLALALLYQWRRDWRLCALVHAGMNAVALGGCALSTSWGVT